MIITLPSDVERDIKCASTEQFLLKSCIWTVLPFVLLALLDSLFKLVQLSFTFQKTVKFPSNIKAC